MAPRDAPSPHEHDVHGHQRSGANAVRVMCATHQNLPVRVESGKFRQDLYYRVNAFAIRLPSLRERAIDVPILAQRFLERRHEVPALAISSSDCRRRAEVGRPIWYLVPDGVVHRIGRAAAPAWG